MILKLMRLWFTDRSTCGELYIDNVRFSYTLELPNKDGRPGSCIAQGTYPVVAWMSRKFGRTMPLLENVPLRDPDAKIEIHWGNSPEDTEGCILLGNTRDTDYIGNSRMAFDNFWHKFMPALSGGTVTITVIGGAKAHDSSGDIHFEEA